MKEVTLSDGFALQVDEAALDNMELLDAMSDLIEEENPLALSRVVRLLLGSEEKKRLYAHVRENGRVSTEKVSAAAMQILTSLGQQAKNS